MNGYLSYLKWVIAFNVAIIGLSTIGIATIYVFDGKAGMNGVRSNFQKHHLVAFGNDAFLITDLQKRQLMENSTTTDLITTDLTTTTTKPPASVSSDSPSVSADDDDDDDDDGRDIVPRCTDIPIEGHVCNDDTRHTLLAAFLLTLILGGFGAGYCYLGYTCLGVVSGFTCGGCGIWAIVLWVMMLTGDFAHDADGCCLLDW